MDEKDEAVSFFVGTDASKNTPVMHLIGDRNLIGQENKDCPAAEVSAGITHLEHDTPQPRWDKDLHREAGNIALGDGSAQQLSQAGLLAQLAQQNSNPNHDNCILKPKPPHSTAGNHLRTFLAITD